jgi:hypothetical protein
VAGREIKRRIVNVVRRNCHLLQIIGALHAASGFAGRLNSRQEQRDEHADDGNDNEELDERESPTEMEERTVHLKTYSAK